MRGSNVCAISGEIISSSTDCHYYFERSAWCKHRRQPLRYFSCAGRLARDSAVDSDNSDQRIQSAGTAARATENKQAPDRGERQTCVAERGSGAIVPWIV